MNSPRGVGATAVFVAAARALESRREDRLFDDPWAGSFVRASGWNPPTEGMAGISREELTTWMAARTKFLDDFVLESVAGGCGQLAFLGAGLDTRAYRLHWPAPVTVYELDTADMLEFKASVVSDAAPGENATRVAVPIDLREDWPAALHGAGFRDDIPTAWVLEGLLMYLTPDDVDALMTRVGDLSASGSTLGATVTTVDFTAVMDDAPVFQDSPLSREEWLQLLQSNGPDDPVAWFDQYGWRARAFPTADLAAQYGRTLPEASDLHRARPGDRWMVSATRA